MSGDVYYFMILEFFICVITGLSHQDKNNNTRDNIRTERNRWEGVGWSHVANYSDQWWVL